MQIINEYRHYERIQYFDKLRNELLLLSKHFPLRLFKSIAINKKSELYLLGLKMPIVMLQEY
jgi:hypothetical protein